MVRHLFCAIGLLCLVLLLPAPGLAESPLDPAPAAALDTPQGTEPAPKAAPEPFPNEVWNAPATDSADAGTAPGDEAASTGSDIGDVAAAKADPHVPNVKNVSSTFKSDSIAKITKIMTKDGQKVWGGKLQALKKAGLLTRIGGFVKFVQSFSNGGSDALLNSFKINKKTYVMILRWEDEAWKVSHLMDISSGFPPPPWTVSFPSSLLPAKTGNKPLP